MSRRSDAVVWDQGAITRHTASTATTCAMGSTATSGSTAAAGMRTSAVPAEVARLMADAGTIAIVSLISPYADARARARALHEGDGLPFVEVWVATTVERCEPRDRKGLYARAPGELTSVTGIDDPYEPPLGAEIVVRPEADPSSVVARVLAVLGERGAVSHE